LFLLWLGVSTFAARPAEEEARARGLGLAGAFGSTFALTLTNPMTILSFVAVFAGLGLGGGAGSAMAALWMVSGVFLGSAAWWLLLSAIVDRLRGGFRPDAMTWVNRASGTVITAFGLLAVWGAWRGPRG
jgi:threonine/homoserine/homoserine lactone efflux protein